MSKCNMNYGVDILIFKGTWSGQTVKHRQAGITFTSSWFARSCSEGSCEMCSSACRDVSRLSRGRIRDNFHTSHIAFDHATAPLTLDWYLYTLYLIIHISLFLGLLWKLNWLACCKLTSHFSGCFSTQEMFMSIQAPREVLLDSIRKKAGMVHCRNLFNYWANYVSKNMGSYIYTVICFL